MDWILTIKSFINANIFYVRLKINEESKSSDEKDEYRKSIRIQNLIINKNSSNKYIDTKQHSF